jgi:hypothetical protein
MRYENLVGDEDQIVERQADEAQAAPQQQPIPAAAVGLQQQEGARGCCEGA